METGRMVRVMSTQEMRIPRGWTRTPRAKRAGAALVAAVMLTAGVVVGRATAPTPQVRTPQPATALADLGPRSIDDLRRAEMFREMNGILPVAPG
jgi:hypothetical protein